jgi:hypothetical protein
MSGPDVERIEAVPAPRALPGRWRERAAKMLARRPLTKVDREYVQGYCDALSDTAGWLELALAQEANH